MFPNAPPPRLCAAAGLLVIGSPPVVMVKSTRSSGLHPFLWVVIIQVVALGVLWAAFEIFIAVLPAQGSPIVRLLSVLVVAGGIGWLLVTGFRVVEATRHRRQAAAQRAAQCKHGTRGAVYKPTLCGECVRECKEQERVAAEQAKIAAEQARVAAEQAKVAAEQDAARRERERQERHREYLRKIRLPEHLRSMHPGEFEHLVCDLFRRQGYEAEPTPLSGDGGVDGYLRKNGALTVLQCKRVKGSVGEPVLRDLFGTMHGCGAVEGIVVTTGNVSTQARAWSNGKPIRIIELDELTVLLRRHYKEDEVVPGDFQPKESSPDLCPDCGRPLRTKNGSRGKFVGCTGYPTCRYTRPLGKTRHRRHRVDHLSS